MTGAAGSVVSKLLLWPEWLAPSVAVRRRAVATCATVTLPVQTPFTKLPVVAGETETDEPRLSPEFCAPRPVVLMVVVQSEAFW